MILADLELEPPIHAIPVSLRHRLMPWLFLACAAILFAAALLHWQRTRHWCLLTLAASSLLVALGAIASIVFLTMMEALHSGAIRGLERIWEWLPVFGLAIGTVGGIGAICWAVRLRRRT